MKKLLAMLLILVVLAGAMAVSASAASNKTGYCEKCETEVTWEPIVWGKVTIPDGQTTVHKHYYCDKDYANASQIILKGGMSACIDLNGKQIVFPGGRGFIVNGATADTPAALSIQDSAGGATVTSHSYRYLNDDGTVSSQSSNGAAGVLWIDNYCTLDIYGGTYRLDVKTPDTLQTGSGGIIALYNTDTSAAIGGVANLHDGVLEGGIVKARGGAVDIQVNCVMNVYGGIIKRGTAPTGSCVNICVNSTSGGTLNLYNAAKVEDINLQSSKAKLQVDSSFTGEAYVKTAASVSSGSKIATLLGDTAFTGELYCYNGSGYQAVVSGTDVNLAALATGQRLKDCVHCGHMKKWDSFTTTAPSVLDHYHYYFTKDYDTSSAKQFTVKDGIVVCLDMNGKSYKTSGRALSTSKSSTNGVAGATLNLMDLVGGGEINGSSGNNNPGGGCISVGADTGGLNLYSGTLSFTATPEDSPWGGTGRGGVIQSAAPVNIYGGKVVGGYVEDISLYAFGAGGAISANSTLNIYGGEIISGSVSEKGAGPCIYVGKTTNKVFVANDAKVDDITFCGLNTSQLTVSGAFSGKLNVTYPDTVTLAEHMTIGVAADNCDLKKATFTCGDYFVHAEDGKLFLSTYSAGIPAATGGVGYNSLQAAINACTDGFVELLNDTPETVTVSKDITLQLNSYSVTGGITVAEDATLYVMDSATDDFTVSDGVYGKLSNVTGNVAGATPDGGFAADSYLLVNEDGVYSAHCVRLNTHTMTLRVDNTDDCQQPGLYYKSDFKADEMAAEKIATFGVALSVIKKPTAENLESSWIKYSVHDHFEAGAEGNLGNNASTLLTGVMKDTNTDKINVRNLNMPIYGRAYAKSADGQVLVGNLVERSLLEQLEGVDQVVPSLAEIQVTGVVKLYNKFNSILSDCELPGIKSAVETHEEGTLKILLLGNSHGVDATRMLYEVFYNEAPEKKVVIGTLYYSGCSVLQHKQHASGNLEVYDYYKNDGSQPNRTWVSKKSTILNALEDEQWDIILMQQMNSDAGLEGNYVAANWKYVADYLLNNQDVEPKLGFHVTWANPDDYELYLNDDAPYNIRYIATYANPAGWRTNHEKWFPDADGKYDTDVMYGEIMRLTQKYLVDSTDFLGRDYFDDQYLMNSATPIHYALKVLGREQLDLYRDYTHMSDYGRLICAYQWYAQLMGLEEITQVKMDTIPTSLANDKSNYPVLTDGVYPVTQDMKDDLIESVNWALKNPWNIPEE